MAKTLREGFTTGTAVAAAATAAVKLLFDEGKTVESVDVPLPPFTGGHPRSRLAVPVAGRFVFSGDVPSEAYCFVGSGRTTGAFVVKDGGDDPDATNGMRLTVLASLSPFLARHDGRRETSGEKDCGRIQDDDVQQTKTAPGGASAFQRYGEAVPEGCFTLCGERFRLSVSTGRGIGMVTLPGLPVPVGEPAFNPEPRKQLYAAVAEVAPEEFEGVIHLYVEAPEGTERAARTLNPRLGILGGISILGTHGTVRPYSHQAFTASISQGLDVAKALGLDTVLLSTGRRSERLLFSLYPELQPQAGIQVADYAAHAVRECVRREFPHVIWGCFPGKLVKLAQGLEWTHASQAALDLNLLTSMWENAGGDPDMVDEYLSMPTAAGIFTMMEQISTEAYRKVITMMARRAYNTLRGWVDGGSAKLSLHVFSLQGEHVLYVGEDEHAR